LHEKKVGIIENRRRFCKIMHGFGCQILACDPEENNNPANRYNLHHIEEVCKTQI
jgi:D-lactate dehydrogenase